MGKQKGMRVFWAAVLVLGLAVLGCAQTKLTILHTNDTHSAMVPFETGSIPAVGADATAAVGRPGLWNFRHFPFSRNYAGIARMAALIKGLRARDGNVLALNAGDVFVGSFEFNKGFGYPELKIMEGLYDAMELGNHEFDLGLDVLAGVLSGQIAGGAAVGLPVLCANVDFGGTAFGPGGPLNGMIQPSIVKTVGGVKVGIFGLVTQEPQNYSAAINARFPYPYEDGTKSLWEFAGETAGALRGQGCQVVICLSHLGSSLDVAALSQVPYIDVIVGGHSHDAYPEAKVVDRSSDGGKVIVVQAGYFGFYLGELKLTVAAGGGVSLDGWTLHRLDGRINENPHVRAAVNRVRSAVVTDPRFGQVYDARVAWAARDIARDWPAAGTNRDTGLGNMITDAFRDRLTKAGFQVDCALDVLGYEGSGIFAGKVVGNNILRAVPYGYDTTTGLDFKVVLVPMTGQLLIGGLEYAADQVTLTSDLGVQASGLTYTYDSSKATGSRVDPLSVLVNGEYVASNLEKVYWVAMSDQVYGFLADLVFQQTGGTVTLPSIPTDLNEYTIVRDYMRALRVVQYNSEGRIRDTAGL